VGDADLEGGKRAEGEIADSAQPLLVTENPSGPTVGIGADGRVQRHAAFGVGEPFL
jgi:hypothetical protein